MATDEPGAGIRVWDLRTGEVRAALPLHEKNCTALTFFPDGETLLVGSSGADYSYVVWNVRSHELHEFPTPAWLHSAAISPDGGTIALEGEARKIRLVAAASGKVVGTLSGHSTGTTALAFSPDGKTLASGGGDGDVKLWHVATEQELCTLESHHRGVADISFSADGKTILTAAGTAGRGEAFLWLGEPESQDAFESRESDEKRVR